MKNRFIVIITFVLVGFQSKAQDVRHDINTIIKLMEKPYRQTIPGNVKVLKDSVDIVMAQVAAKATPEIKQESKTAEGKLFTNKILLLAEDRIARKSLYDEIETTYITGVDDPKRQAPSSPILEQKHMTETYRLPWEYYLLFMPLYQPSDKAEMRALTALQKINNSASEPALKNYSNAISAPSVKFNRSLELKQKYFIDLLSSKPSDQNFRILFDFVRRIDAVKSTQTVEVGYFQPDMYWVQSINSISEVAKKQQWINFSESNRPPALNQKDAALLKHIQDQIKLR